MNFRTELTPQQSGFTITHLDGFMLLGSCFVENIGQKLLDAKFSVRINPFGTIYNPLSISKSINILLDKKLTTESELVYHNESWYSYDHHSRFSNPDKQVCLQMINGEIEQSHHFLKQAKIMILTFGTAWVYELESTGEVVSNCHKLPASHFNHRLLSVQQIVDSLGEQITKLREVNAQLKIIYTLSPIRHLSDGAENNSLSKAILRLAIEKLCAITQSYYFPSYELLLDDLRDYRFYANDLCHPSQQAIDYIWEKFEEVFFNPPTRSVIQSILQLNNALYHLPFNIHSQAYQDFLLKNIAIIDNLKMHYPSIELQEIRQEFIKRKRLE